ncbi:MAG TPA: FdhF/YdeP family oxidoreductase [Xanthomonadaceae bacterium]
MDRKIRIEPYPGPAGGWGSLKSVAEVLRREKVKPLVAAVQLWRLNKADGVACVSCAWPKPARPHLAEFCENGVKATAWEITTLRTGPEFFAQHSVSELLAWSDYDLEQHGRLTHPMRYDATSDKYVPVDWDSAFAEIGRELKALDPKSAVFYASGRASLETSYMYALFARMHGNNNLPDSSNMCHETSGIGMRQSIGTPVGTVLLDDFEATDCILFFGQNVGSNSPRLLHDLQRASRRGAAIITFNPLRERGLERFRSPQSLQMLTGTDTPISSHYYQVRAGGDIAAIMGLCKWLIEADDEALLTHAPRVLDAEFIAQHTHGFEAFAEQARTTQWSDIERESGLSHDDIETAARAYANAKAAIGCWGMGLTQHRRGLENVHMVCNLLLLRGHVGRRGAGLCPIRGHSNVQGQRTVGIADDPALVPLDRLAQQYGFEPPRGKGLNTVETCEGILDGSVHAFIGLGGNFVRAAPETEALERAWSKLRLSVQVSTKLNRSHLIHGEVSYILPCLGRIERDVQTGGAQSVSMEDSTSCIHGSTGQVEPASPHLLSEPAIVAGIAKATLAPNPRVDWDTWVADYARVRDAIEQTYPEHFRDFNRRLFQPGGFHRPNSARERRWKTASGKANFLQPTDLSATGFADEPGVMRLITLRSNDQFNTTIYGYEDRFRGVSGTRLIVFMHVADIARHGLVEGEQIALVTHADDGVHREVSGLRVVAYDIPTGCIGAYYPECNPLIPVWHHAEGSMVPAAKSVPVTIRKVAGAAHA